MTHNLDAAATVRAEMGRVNMTQTALAAELGVSQPWVNRRLNGRIDFTLTDLTRISGILGVDLLALITGRAA